MSRYIDADDVLELLNLMYDNQEDKDDPYNVGVMGAINYIKHKAPTIDIVRCGECENFIPMTHGCKRSPSVEPWWEDDFCSYGERKESE